MGLVFNPLLNNGFDRTSSGSGGVTNINGITGAVTFAAGTNVTLVPVGNTITINSTSVSTAPAGLNKQVQFNNSGTFGAAAGFEYDSAKLSFKSGNTSNVATGFYSTALGSSTTATGNYTFVTGGGNTSSSDYSASFGNTTTASGIASFSLGNQSLASGENSLSGGLGTIAQGYAQLSIGSYNIAQGSSGTLGPTDNIFIIGNGSGSGSRKNAFTISADSIMKIYGSTSGFVGQKTTASPVSYTVTWPGAQGAVSTSLINDGSGNLSWVPTNSLITFNKENITLSGTDIINQYVDLAHLVIPNSVTLAVTKAYQVEGSDYTLSTVGIITRLTFAGDLAIGGASALIAGNILNIQYTF